MLNHLNGWRNYQLALTDHDINKSGVKQFKSSTKKKKIESDNPIVYGRLS